jgi:hypothetical protein
MVAGVRFGADLSIDSSIEKPFGRARIEQQMIKSKAGITLPSVPHVIPERVHRLIRKRLLAHAVELYALDAPVVLAGDCNVVPTDADIYPSKSYAKNALVPH